MLNSLTWEKNRLSEKFYARKCKDRGKRVSYYRCMYSMWKCEHICPQKCITEYVVGLYRKKRLFFLNLLWEHLEISLLAIVIAVLFGGIVGIFISEFRKTAKPTLGVINFLYTIPSISMLGFLIPFSGD